MIGAVEIEIVDAGGRAIEIEIAAARYVSLPLVRSPNGTNSRSSVVSVASANAVSVSASPFNVNSSVPTRFMRRRCPVDVGMSRMSSAGATLSDAGTRYSASTG